MQVNKILKIIGWVVLIGLASLGGMVLGIIIAYNLFY